MRFRYKIVCPDTGTFDWFTATVGDQSLDGYSQTLSTIVPKRCSNSGSWQTASINVSSPALHTLVLTLMNHDNGYASDPTYTLVDDVKFQ